MNVAVRDMMTLRPLWRRNARRKVSRSVRRVPVAPVTQRWEGLAASLRGAMIMAAGLVLAGVLGWIWATVTDPRWLPIAHVEVEGSFRHVDAKDVRDVIAPYLAGNLMTVDVRQVQQVVETLPWVRSAEIWRSWPDAIHVAVVEQVAVANWGEGALLNDAGEIFIPSRDTFPPGLPQVYGPEGMGGAVIKAYVDMNAIVSPLGAHIAKLNLDERRAWSLQLDNGMQLILGRGEGYGRLLRFVRFYHRALRDQVTRVEKVDLRYSNGFAVRWKTSASENYKSD